MRREASIPQAGSVSVLDICVTSLTKEGQICSINAGMNAEENVPSGLTWATVCTGSDYSSYHPCL